MKKCFVVINTDWSCHDNVCGVYIADSEKDVISAFTDDMDDEDLGGLSPADWMEYNDYMVVDKYLVNLTHSQHGRTRI